MRSFLMLSICFFGMSPLALGAVPPKQAPPKPARLLSGQGALSGGMAGAGFSITNVTLAKTPQKDRVVIDFGDLKGKTLKGLPAYYHAELQNNPSRLILDFSQTPHSKLEESEIRSRLKASGRVTGSTLLVDPVDQTMTLIFDLKKGTKAQVFQVRGEKGTSRVVVDLQ